MGRVMFVRGIAWLWADRAAEEPHVVVVMLESGTVGVRAPLLTGVGWLLEIFYRAPAEEAVLSWTRSLEEHQYELLGDETAVVRDPFAMSDSPDDATGETCFDPLLKQLMDRRGARLDVLDGLIF